MKGIKKLFLFFSSYSPLIIMLLLLKINFLNMSFLEMIILLLSSIFIITGYIILYYTVFHYSKGSEEYEIHSIENKNDMMHTYLMPYLVFIFSFISLEILNINQIIAFIILFVILFIIYINSDLFLFDIILIAKGYAYYKVSTEYNVFIVLSKDNMYEKKNEKVNFRFIDDNILKYEG